MKSIHRYSFLFFATVLTVFAGCSKKYRYDFMDGYSKPAANDSVELDLDTAHIDRSKYGVARMFPGLVSEKEPRLKGYKVNLDLDFIMPDKSLLRISVVPKPWFSTGLYAPAGELIEIDVPESVYGLTAQTGVWNDNLTGKSDLLRDPLIINKKALFPGKNYIRNLYGGPLTIVASRALGRQVTLKVTGAVKSPDFVLGKTTDAEWKEMISKTTVPWFELRGKRIIFDLPVSKLHAYPLNNPTELMKAWDSVIVQDYNQWYGLSDHPSDPRDLAPQLSWRVVQDIQPSVGYGHNGYPVVAKMDDNWFRQITSVHDLRNSSDWGTLHEVGHNFQMGSTWKWSALGEVSNNLHSFKVANRYGHKHSKMTSNDFATALTFAASDDENKEFTDLNVTERLVPFVQIFEKYGYDFQTYLTTQARHDQHTAISDQNKIDFYYERLSEFVGMDMKRFMNHWGLVVSQQAANKISGEYPPLNKNVWEYNPWTGEGGDDVLPIPRDGWKVLGYDSDHPGREVNKLFDGERNTIWSTEWVGGRDPYPHWFKIDMLNKYSPTGFYIYPRVNLQYDQNPKTINIYVGNDPNNLTKVISDFQLPDKDEETKIPLPQGLAPFRYFKMEFMDSWATSGGGTATMDLSEVGLY